MKNPLFSIAVPTVDRPETFYYTLKTLSALDGDDFEVVVSDNFGPDENKKIVDKFQDDMNLTYIRQSERISMRQNYEAIISACNGEYITILGDDDGFARSGLSQAREVLKQMKVDLLFWFPHMYWWPNALIPGKRNLLYLNLASLSARQVRPVDYVKNLFENQQNYWLFERLPSIYNGFISRRLIDRVIDRFGGYFNDELPDVYSGVVNGVMAESGVFIDRPLTVRGNSGKSTGVAFRNKKQGAELVEDYKRLAQLPICDDDLIDSSALAVHIASVRLRAIRSISELSDYSVNIADVIRGILSELPEDPDRYDDLISDAKKLAAKYGLLISEDVIPGKTTGKTQRDWGLKYSDGTPSLAIVDGEQIKLKNIYDASKAVSAILG